MNRHSDIAASLGRLNARDSASTHQFEMALDLLTSPPVGDGSAAPGLLPSVGPWDICALADGVVEWRVRAHTSLRERHSWRLQTLSSKRSETTFRVILFGSSAAASFGYWGDFTLATALETKLRAALPDRAVEVIDLACVNATWPQILDTMRSAATLTPDLAVVYCGNNEAKTLEARLSTDLRRLPSAFAARWVSEANAVAGYPALLNACLREHTARMARATAECARTNGVKLVFVVPEYNLADWRPRERLPFHLSGDCSREWHRQVLDAETALTLGDANGAAQRFEAVAAFDTGQSRRVQAGRALALRELSHMDAAREAFLSARDTGIGPVADGIPQITADMVSAMRETFAELKEPCVDLPALLAADRCTGVPDRTQFLDYCHLGAHGHDLLAASIARQILGHEVTPNGSLRPSPKEESLASLVAAIHNFHHGQPLEVTCYWLERSLAHWLDIRPLFEFLAEHLCELWRERFTVEWFREAGLFDLLGEKYFFFFCKFFYHARFDHEMAELLHQVLRTRAADFHASFARQTTGMLRDLDGNLLSLFFLDRRRGFTTSDRHAARVGWERPALEIYVNEPVSTCEFPLDAGSPDLTLRLQLTSLVAGRPLICLVSINNVEVASLGIERQRQHASLLLPARHLVAGLNRLTFCWNGCLALDDLPPGLSRRRFIKRYGYYPVIARLHTMRLEMGSPEYRKEDTGC